MIYSLRRRHYKLFWIMGPLLAVLYFLAIGSREEMPIETIVPHHFSPMTPAAAPDHASTIWEAFPVTFQAYNFSTDSAFVELRFEPEADFRLPDLLVYWCPALESDVPGMDSILLCALHGRAPVLARLPRREADNGGYLALFSLAHGRIVASELISLRIE